MASLKPRIAHGRSLVLGLGIVLLAMSRWKVVAGVADATYWLATIGKLVLALGVLLLFKPVPDDTWRDRQLSVPVTIGIGLGIITVSVLILGLFTNVGEPITIGEIVCLGGIFVGFVVLLAGKLHFR